MNIFERLIKRAYAPHDTIKGKYDLVVAIDYGSVRAAGDVLPLASKATIRTAATFVDDETARNLSWANSINYLANDDEMDRAKAREVYIFTNLVVTSQNITCTNTIQEAENILASFPSAQRIILVCEWRHAARTKYIWKKITAGKIKIDVVTVDADWAKENHPSPWCNSNWKFLLMNLIHHSILIVGGERAMRFLKDKKQKMK